MFSYFAYGLGVESTLAIPEFIPAEVECDVTIHVDSEHMPNDYISDEVIKKSFAIKLSRETAVLYLKDIAVFLVEHGNQITIVPSSNSCEHLIRLALVGSVMAILLYQRGLLVLHASVVNIDGGAVAFLGVSGEGKSSTAAAFYVHGYGLLSDDVAPVILEQKSASIIPGFPQIKLSRATAAAVGYDFQSLLELHPQVEKRGYRLKQNFIQSPLPIRRIYTLANDTEFGVELLSPKDSVMELVRHSRPTTICVSGGAPHLMQCTALAKKHNIYRLKRPRDLELLPKLVKLVEEHVGLNS